MKQVVISKLGLHLMFLLLPAMAWAQWAGPDKTFLSGQNVGMDIGEAPWEVGEYCYTWSEGLNAHIPQNQDIHQPVIRVFPTDTVEVYNVQRVGPWGVEEDQVVLRRVDTVTIVSITPKKSCFTYGKDLSVSLEDFEIVTSPAEYKQYVRLISPRNGRLSSAPPIDITQYMPNLFGGDFAIQEFIDRTTPTLNLLNYYRTQPAEQTVAVEFGFRGLVGINTGPNVTVNVALMNPMLYVYTHSPGEPHEHDFFDSLTLYDFIHTELYVGREILSDIEKIGKKFPLTDRLSLTDLLCLFPDVENQQVIQHVLDWDLLLPVKVCYKGETEHAIFAIKDPRTSSISFDCHFALLGLPFIATLDLDVNFALEYEDEAYKGFITSHEETTEPRRFHYDISLGGGLGFTLGAGATDASISLVGEIGELFTWRPGFQPLHVEVDCGMLLRLQYGLLFSLWNDKIDCPIFKTQPLLSFDVPTPY